MIHPPDVIGKYAPDAVIGMVGTGAPAAAGAAKGGAKGGAPVRKDKGSSLANHQAWGHMDGASNWRIEGADGNPGVLLINVKAYMHATWYLLLSVLYEVCATIFSAKNIKLSNDRVGLTRSAILLILFIVIHAVGNLHVFMGPDDFNGYGYFYVRLYWTGFGLPANIVEEYIMLSVLLHALAGLKRTMGKLQFGFKGGNLNLAVTGLMLLTFMTIHLFQFRFGDTDQFGPYYVRPPTFLINFVGILSLNLFWTDDTTITPVGVRDIYALEFQIFKNPVWSVFYSFCVIIFMTHYCLGWQKVVTTNKDFGIPVGHQKTVEKIGYAIGIVIGLVYISFPVFVTLTDPFA